MAKAQSHKPHILHLHSSFSPGGKEVRCTQLMNAFGARVQHSIVSGMPDQMGASKLINQNIAVRYPRNFPSLQGKPLPGRLMKIAEAMKPYDLICTYNWGAMDAVMAHTMLSDMHSLPPLIHHEDGFNEDEAHKLKWGRNWFRRIALGKSAGLVVPSEQLEEIALTTWMQPIGRVKRFPNGIKTGLYDNKPKPNALRVVKHTGERWVGTLAGLRAVKQLPMLVRAFAQLPDNWNLVILGEGPEKEAIQEQARALEIGHRVHLPGHVAEPAKAIGLFDMFALSSKSEQFPISVVEAMATGLAVAAPAVGDIATMVSEGNAEFITAPDDPDALGRAMNRLARDPELRKTIGAANKAKARCEFDESVMVDRYKRLYSSAMGETI